ncbi:jg12267 [Pararge aegeria aegeria]|uniref:Jg12267 protein n=1 Tax=Pararge aegeria aegeria TaxID=348720 RepID=A0A8S4QU46_9NEOP|nr:jg12267 [Pararge aegeria aegeria]
MQQSNVSATPSCSSKVVILSDVPYHGDLLSHKKRQNKASKDPKKYKRNINKELRMKGENYLGYRRDRKAKINETFKVKQDIFKPARSMKPPCTSAFCKKSKLRSCDNINEEQRKHLFENFWQNMNWEQRRSFITSHVNKIPKKITKNPESSKRTDSRTYVLTIDNVRHQVCKKMFLATLGIKDWFIRYWLTKTDCAMPPDSSTSTSNRRNPEKIEDHKYIEKFLADLPKMPSHYCRAKTSRENFRTSFHEHDTAL